MSCEGACQYLTPEGLLREIDFMVTFYGDEEDKKELKYSIWHRGYETTNGYGDEPYSTDFPFTEGCVQQTGWKEYNHTDYKGNDYVSREPTFRPPTGEWNEPHHL